MRTLSCYLMIAGFALSGCSPQHRPEQHRPEQETNFFRDFSLSEFVDRIKPPELVHWTGGAGDSTAAGEATKRRKVFNLIYKIEEQEGARFDESRFANELRDEINKALSKANVRADGAGSSGDNFHFEYSSNDHEGWLEVMAARVEGNKYRLYGVLREIARKPE